MDVHDKKQRATKDMHRRKEAITTTTHYNNQTPYRDEYIRNSRSFPIYEETNALFNIYEDKDGDDKLNKIYAEKGRLSISAQHDKFNSKDRDGGVGGLGDELIKWMKKATISKEEMRKPLGDNVASPGRKLVQKKGAEKRDLEKIHKRVQSSDMC